MPSDGVFLNKIESYRGVTHYPKRRSTRKWVAQIGYRGEMIYLGGFLTAIEAAKAYDRAAKMLHEDNAILNFP